MVSTVQQNFRQQDRSARACGSQVMKPAVSGVRTHIHPLVLRKHVIEMPKEL